MARMSISLPDELKDETERLSQVNWSGIAQRAFEAELRRHVTISENDMDAVIERLRASKMKQVDEIQQAGVEAGKEWASQTAEFLELKFLAENYGDTSNAESLSLSQFYSKFDYFPQAFWEDCVGFVEGAPDENFEFGFVKGATAIWESVCRKI